MRTQGFSARLVEMFAGPLIWAAHFLFIYIFQALACARGFADIDLFGVGIVPLTVGVATVAAAVATIFMLLVAMRDLGAIGSAAERDAERFMNWMTAAGAGLSLVAVLWDGLPVLLLPPCQ
ncbi:hypothetical protein [Rhodospirillaceae bacterium SYSU D60014]|uniref:hypothetical protein n=1 Tax=Virgifigura deserti TaxID=2268457 RepID=UPI000E66BF34